MSLQLLGWSLLTVLHWTSGSEVILSQENLTVLYPKIGESETLDCDCAGEPCDAVFWFNYNYSNQMNFIGKCNNADRVNWGAVDKSRFRLTKRGTTSFVLRIINVTEKDKGIYSCVLKDKSDEKWKPGTLLLPGVTPPTVPPKTKHKPPTKSYCSCNGKKTKDGCDSLVLWPLVGLVAGLGLALLCTLYYFSRLPKKCRHHFVKKRQMI